MVYKHSVQSQLLNVVMVIQRLGGPGARIKARRLVRKLRYKQEKRNAKKQSDRKDRRARARAEQRKREHRV